MSAINQKSFSNSVSQSSAVGSDRTSGLTVIDSVDKITTILARRIDERESELEHVAVLAYD